MSLAVLLLCVFAFGCSGSFGQAESVLAWGPSASGIENNANGADLSGKVFVNIDKVVIFLSPDYVDPDRKLVPEVNRTLFHWSSEVYDKLKEVKFKTKTEFVHLLHSPVEEEQKIVETFRELESQYGEGRVLGVLVGPEVSPTHARVRRATPDYYYIDPGKTLLKTSRCPSLRLPKGWNHGKIYHQDTKLYKLDQAAQVVPNPAPDADSLTLHYALKKSFTAVITFNFDRNLTHWKMSDVVLATIEDDVYERFDLVQGDRPSAQLGKSYHCDAPVVFQGSVGALTIANIRVQPYLLGSNKFGGVGNECPKPQEATNWWLMIGGIIGAVVILLIICCIICKLCR